jgi:hypothetical protein
MAFFRLFLKPGIDKQNTEYGAEGGWTDGDYVRFRYGLPEKIGGWTQFNGSTPALVGMVSEIFSWNALSNSPYLAVGTTKKVYIFYGGGWGDVTPIRDVNSGVTFDTTNGSTTIVVNDTGHGAITGDFVTLSSVSGNPGGIPNATLEVEYEITKVLNANSYELTAPAAATSTASATGSATATYQINVGSDVSYFDFGWGTGSWGLSTWGTPRPASVALTLLSRVWQFDTFGEKLILQFVDGGLYEWSPAGGITTRATVISGAPTKNKYSLVSTPDRHLVVLGTESVIGNPNTQDPMYVRFSSQENINDFVATATNTAGGQRLTDGNRIVSAVRSRGQILIWTDTSLHAMQYVGPPFTFSFQQLGANCGLIGPHASVDVNGVAYWMARDAFHVFDGTVKKLPCTVQDYVFKDINLDQFPKVHVGVNTQFNEVTWWYCSANSEQIDRCVTLNYLEQAWSIGTLSRTAWEDIGTYSKPIASQYLPSSTSPTISTIYGLKEGRSLIYNHEDGQDADGSPITSYIYSGYFDIGEGDQMMLMSKFIPDFKNQIGNLSVELRLRPYPQATAIPSSLDPYVIAPGTQFVNTRARGRQIQLRITGTELGGNWRYGTMRVDIQPDGLR